MWAGTLIKIKRRLYDIIYIGIFGWRCDACAAVVMQSHPSKEFPDNVFDHAEFCRLINAWRCTPKSSRRAMARAWKELKTFIDNQIDLNRKDAAAITMP